MDGVLVTGAAGFIGFHVSSRLLELGHRVIAVDNLNDYYDVSLKEARLRLLSGQERFHFHRLDISDTAHVEELFKRESFSHVVHLAAQAGVRYSLQNPHAYGASNLTGFLNILEGCRQRRVEHLVYASSSSVYGGNHELPFSVEARTDHPVSLYAATKKANEVMAHAYSHLYALPTTGLRFFTVYGPWGRPDMAYFLFTKAILVGRTIDVFNDGKLERDFTYIDDVVEGVVRTLARIPSPSAPVAVGATDAPYRLYNIGNHKPVPLMCFIETLERALGRRALKRMLPMQPGDVLATYADVDDLIRDTGFQPSTPLATGLERFVAWYREYYGVIGA